jgi:hypothetical protein
LQLPAVFQKNEDATPRPSGQIPFALILWPD